MGDRPLGRALIRLGAMALGPDRAHRQDLWPYLAIDRDCGEVRWRGRFLTRTVPFSAVVPRAAPLLAIIGSGPSLKDQPIENLPDGSAILLNGAASLVGRVQPLAVAIEDERFVFRHVAMLEAVPRGVPLFLSPAAMRALAAHGPGLLQGRAICLIDNLAKPVNQPRRSVNDPALRHVVRRGAQAALSLAPEKGVVITGTVAFSALQIALAADPAKVLLAGIDLTNDDQPRFYEGRDRAPSGLQKGKRRILDGFALALDEAGTRGIALGCASPVSALLDIGYAPAPL